MSYRRAVVVVLDGEFAAVDPKTGEVVATGRSWAACLWRAWNHGYVAACLS